MPAMTSRIRTLGVLIICLLLVALVTRNPDVAMLLLIFLVYLGVGILQSPSRENIKLDAERTLVHSQVNGRTQVEVRLCLHDRAPVPLQLRIADDLRAGMQRLDGESSGHIALRPGESATLRYTFTAERGSYIWDSLSVVVSDPLGLIETALALPAHALAQIRPRIQRHGGDDCVFYPGLFHVHFSKQYFSVESCG